MPTRNSGREEKKGSRHKTRRFEKKVKEESQVRRYIDDEAEEGTDEEELESKDLSKQQFQQK